MRNLFRRLFLLLALLPSVAAAQQYVYGTTPALHVEGNVLKDPSGGTVVLHGVMDTPSPYFNSYRWGTWWNGFTDDAVEQCRNYFDQITSAITQPAKGTYCNLFRLHLDPCWTNDPAKTATGSGQEEDISRFSADRLRSYFNSLYLPIALNALSKGLYVIIRPPGVFPQTVNVGGEYNNYLMTVWDIVSSNATLKQYSGQISLELGNEPVSVKNRYGQDDSNALHDFFQPIVNKIRQNGFDGILWIPGTGWQSNYRDYLSHPIQDGNFGYAVHNYVGWYNGSNTTSYDEVDRYINQFHFQVPVIDTNPIVITEVDWSPEKAGTGHYNEHGDWVVGNYGTWATGTTSNWGRLYKALLDHYGTISMTLSGTDTYLDVDAYLNDGTVRPAFQTAMMGNGYGSAWEACSGACFEWYKQWAMGQISHVANFAYDASTGRCVVNLSDLVAGGSLSFNSSTGEVTLPAHQSGSLTLTYNGADFSNVSKVKLSHGGDDVFNTLTVSNTRGESVNGGAFWTSKYQLDYTNYQDKGAVSTLVWDGYNDSDVAKMMTIRQLLIQVDVMRAEQKHERSLDRWAFGVWDGIGADARRTGNDDNMEYNIDEVISGYGTIYGNGNVLATRYVDLSGYSKLRVYGDDGLYVRALFNRPTDTSSDFVEKNGAIANGVFEIDLAGMGSYVHLNALKVGGGTGSAWRVMVVKDDDAMDYRISGKLYVKENLVAALSDIEATNYDATALRNSSGVMLTPANRNALFYVDDASRLSNPSNVVVKSGNSYTSASIVLTDPAVVAGTTAGAYFPNGAVKTGNATWSDSGNGTYTFHWAANTQSEVQIFNYILERQDFKRVVVETSSFTKPWGIRFYDNNERVIAEQGYWAGQHDGNRIKEIDIDSLFAVKDVASRRSTLTMIRLYNIAGEEGEVVLKSAYLCNRLSECYYPFRALYDIAASSATLNSTVPAAGFTTVTVPFAVSVPSGHNAYALNRSGVSSVNAVEANRPVLLTGAGEAVFSASNVTVKASDELTNGLLQGTYSRLTPSDGFVQRDDAPANVQTFNPVGDVVLYAVTPASSVTLYPFRAYATSADVVEPIVLTVTSAGVATTYLPYDAVIPDADFFVVAVVKEIAGTTARLKRVRDNIIPANTGVLIFANAGDYVLAPSPTACTESVVSLLHGVLESTSVKTLTQQEGKSIYVLSRGTNEYIGFKKATGSTTVKTIPAHKAYLPFDDSGEAKSISFSFGEDDALDIDLLKYSPENTADIYDLTGRKVAAPKKGIYIVNGKKVLYK